MIVIKMFPQNLWERYTLTNHACLFALHDPLLTRVYFFKKYIEEVSDLNLYNYSHFKIYLLSQNNFAKLYKIANYLHTLSSLTYFPSMQPGACPASKSLLSWQTKGIQSELFRGFSSLVKSSQVQPSPVKSELFCTL